MSRKNQKIGDVRTKPASLTGRRTSALALKEKVTSNAEDLELERAAQNRLLARAIASVGEGVLITDATDGRLWPDARIVFVNESMCRTTGYTADELIGQPRRILAGRATNAETLDRMASELSAGKPCRAELLSYRKDGTSYPADVFVTPLLDTNGQVTNYVTVHRDIAEIKKKDLALQESERRFRQMADNAPVMIWISGHDKLCTWFNKRWLEFTGRTIEQEMGNGWAEGVHPEDFQRCLETYGLSFDARRPFSMEYRLRRNDAEWRWLLDMGIPLHQEDGAFVGYIGSCIDITDRKRAEEALCESEYRLKAQATALAHLNEAGSRLWHMDDLSKGLEEMLAATMGLLGADMGNVQILDTDRRVLTIAAHRGFGQDFLNFFHEVSTVDNSACGRALRAGKRILIEDVDADPLYAPLRAIAHSAGYRAVQSTPMIGRNGTPLGMLSTHWRSPHQPSEQDLGRMDLYVRQAADFIESCRRDQMLRESENRMRSILHTAADAIITIDRRGVIVSANHATVRMFGYEEFELLGQNVKLLMPYMARYLETGKARIIGVGSEVVGLRKDGSTFPADLAVSEVEDLGLFTGIVRDISLRQQAERELTQSKRDLRAMSSEMMLIEERERQRLAQDLHDGMGQALFLARKKLGDAKSEHQAASEVGPILDKVGRMVNELTLELSAPVLHQLGLRAAIKWIARDMKQRYAITVQVNDDGQAIPVNDRVGLVLFRSIRELLINIAKHAQTGDAILSLQRVGHTLQVQVADRGKGFNPAELSSRVEAGHFGLFSIRERIAYLDGTVSIQSAHSEGTRVTLIVPLAAETEKAATTHAEGE